MCKCKAAMVDKRYGDDPGKHKSVIDEILCPMCENKTKRYYYHGPTEDYSGHVLECAKCRSYVRYLFATGELEKDELYFGDTGCLIRLTGYDFYSWCPGPSTSNKPTVKLPKFEITRELFMDKERLLNKIKTYMVFQ